MKRVRRTKSTGTALAIAVAVCGVRNVNKRIMVRYTPSVLGPLWARKVKLDAASLIKRTSVSSRRTPGRVTRHFTTLTTRVTRTISPVLLPVALPVVAQVVALLPPPIADYFISPDKITSSKEKAALIAAIHRGGAIVVFVGISLWSRAGGPIDTLESSFEEARSWNWVNGREGILFEMESVDVKKKLLRNRLLGRIFHGALQLLRDGHGVWDAAAQPADSLWLHAWRTVVAAAPAQFANAFNRESLRHGSLDASGNYHKHPFARASSAEFCCGIGSGGVGLSRNWIHRMLGVDHEEAVQHTYNSTLRHGDAKMTVACVSKVNKQLAALKLRGPTVLLTTFDCSPFTSIGNHLDNNDPRTKLTLKALPTWLAVQFKVVLFENAVGYMKSKTFVIVDALLRQYGYGRREENCELDASCFGVAHQVRIRSFPPYFLGASTLILDRFIFPREGKRNSGATAAVTPLELVPIECFVQSEAVLKQLVSELPRLKKMETFSGWVSFRSDVGFKGFWFVQNDCMPTIIRNRSGHPIARVRASATSKDQFARRPTPYEISASVGLNDGEMSLAHSNANTMASWLGSGVSPNIIESLAKAALFAIDEDVGY